MAEVGILSAMVWRSSPEIKRDGFPFLENKTHVTDKFVLDVSWLRINSKQAQDVRVFVLHTEQGLLNVGVGGFIQPEGIEVFLFVDAHNQPARRQFDFIACAVIHKKG